jgi:hypothetical protein
MGEGRINKAIKSGVCSSPAQRFEQFETYCLRLLGLCFTSFIQNVFC